MPKFGHLELFVRDVPRARRFYQDVLGFELSVEQGAYVWLGSGGVEVLLRPGDPQPPVTYGASAIAMVLYTDDLASTMRTLEERGVVFEATDGSDGCQLFRDPDGHWIQLVNPTAH